MKIHKFILSIGCIFLFSTIITNAEDVEVKDFEHDIRIPTKEQFETRFNEIIKHHKIDFDEPSLNNYNLNSFDLHVIQNILGVKLALEYSGKLEEDGLFVKKGESMISYRITDMPNRTINPSISVILSSTPKRAKEIALYSAIFQIHDSHVDANNPLRSIDVNNPKIGDLSFRPKKWSRDPHGIHTPGDDEVSFTFAFGNATILIGSHRRFNPEMDVLGIARKIQKMLLEKSAASSEHVSD